MWGKFLMTRNAIFFDRDGVLTQLIQGNSANDFHAPLSVDDLRLCTGVLPALARLTAEGFELFLISNQPDCAKGTATFTALQDVHAAFHAMLKSAGIAFREYYYCYHHPKGTNPGLSGVCQCRKPSPHFLFLARDHYGVNLQRSWTIGDRDTDIICGQAAGTRTILITNPQSRRYQGESIPTYSAMDIIEATTIILSKYKDKID
jgi:D-glycero-D-manno-heptose 1,7-bisphosphate phosphatase